jgi:nucleotide-binding universal stress UspA family protein
MSLESSNPSGAPGSNHERVVFERILVAVHSGAACKWGIDAAVSLAQQMHARIALVHVIDATAGFSPEQAFDDEQVRAEAQREGWSLLERAAAFIPRELTTEKHLSEGSPDREILRIATTWKAQLIVLGTRHRGRLSHFLLGSTTESVIRYAQCPVLTVGSPPHVSVAGNGNKPEGTIAAA